MKIFAVSFQCQHFYFRKVEKILMKGIKIFYDTMLQWRFPTTFQKSFKMYNTNLHENENEQF